MASFFVACIVVDRRGRNHFKICLLKLRLSPAFQQYWPLSAIYRKIDKLLISTSLTGTSHSIPPFLRNQHARKSSSPLATSRAVRRCLYADGLHAPSKPR